MNNAITKYVGIISILTVAILIGYLTYILINLFPIKCRNNTELGYLLNTELSDAQITAVETDIDLVNGYTTVMVVIAQDDFLSKVQGYHNSNWLELDGRKEPMPSSDLKVFEKHNISPNTVVDYGYSFRDIKRGISEVEYQISYYIILDSTEQDEDTYVVIATIPRIVIVDKHQ